jgi:hypothetical protein
VHGVDPYINILPSSRICFRRIILLIFVSVLPVMTAAQESILDQFVILPDTTCRLDTALNIIEEATGYYFSYNTDIISVGDTVKLRSPGDTLSIILRDLINDPDVQFKIIGNLIVIANISESAPKGKEFTAKAALPETITIRGKIIENNSGNPIPFATVSLTGTRIGSISNADGNFVFKCPRIFSQDSVIVSCMGFKMEKIRLDYLDTAYSEIRLIPEYIPIQEVVIRKTDPVSLLHSSIARIPDNYFTGPVNLTTFYRESVKKGNHYVMISEAILEIFRSGFNEKFPLDQVKLIKARKNVDIQNTDTVTLKLKAGLQTSLILDIVRNKPEFFNEDFFNYYTYDMTDIILDEDRDTYVITFKQHSYTEPPHYEGKIFIDMESLGIRAFEFHINPETINQAAKYLVIRKPRNMDVIPVSAEYYVRYRNEKDKLYLNYILSDNVFRIKKKNQLFSRTFETVTEMAVTNTQTENVTRFRIKETTDIDDLFVDQVGGYDESFWGDYNFIKPDEPLEVALKRIVGLMEKQGK